LQIVMLANARDALPCIDEMAGDMEKLAGKIRM
jgi:hypothetical protein